MVDSIAQGHAVNRCPYGPIAKLPSAVDRKELSVFHVRQWGVWADKAGLNAHTRTSTFEPCPSRPTVVLCPPPPRSDSPPDAQGTEPGVEPPPGHQMLMQRGRRVGATQPLRETARRKRRRSANAAGMRQRLPTEKGANLGGNHQGGGGRRKRGKAGARSHSNMAAREGGALWKDRFE